MISKNQNILIQILKAFLIMLLALLLKSCASTPENTKLNGISLVASRDSLKTEQIDPLISVNANAVALMPYAFMRSNKQPDLFYNIERQWYGERVEGIEQAISILHERNMKIMIKPHIWIRNGFFTGDLDFASEEEWLKFEESYKAYILLYAEIAEKYEIELFCIGTELFSFVNKRPGFWQALIAEVRKNYSGKIVYAENWDKVDKTDIWKYTDYIGADAYFPIHEDASPSKDEIAKGWKTHKSMLEDLSSNYHKPVLFTEYGYRNIDHALKTPWNSERENSKINHELQARALEVIYQEFWTENWFSGGFLWKWHQHESSGGLENDRFTPQNKPAEKIVRDYYQRFRN